VSNSHSENSIFLQQLAERQPRRRFKLGDGLRRIEHLDGGHAHFARRLQIAPETIEVNASFWIDAERLDASCVLLRKRPLLRH
jgi:hypothetical protein